MKGTVKLKKCLEALGLALLFMLQSVLGFVLVLTANFIVRKVDEDSALF